MNRNTWIGLCTAALLSPIVVPGEAAGLDADSLIRSLARPAPVRTPFLEVRYSSMLEVPIILRGDLEYRAPDALSKRIESPYHEQLDISAEEVRVTRDKRPERHFSLSRAPELRSLLASFSGLLSGDRARLEQVFAMDLSGSVGAWRLGLTPREAKVAKRLKEISITGRNATPECLIVTSPDGDASVMILGDAASKPLPEPLTLGGLRFRCRD